MTLGPRIPCLLYPYRNAEAIKQSLESIANCSDILDLYVIENKSDRTDAAIRPYVEGMVRAGVVKKYILFDENISNNAMTLSIEMLRSEISSASHVILSDLDLIVQPGLIEEQIAILDHFSELFACGMQVDPDSWGENFAKIAEHHKALIAERSKIDLPYIPLWSGMWMAMFRSSELLPIVDAANRNGYRLTDGVVGRFGRLWLGKTWAITRHSVGQDLTRRLPEEDGYPALKAANGMRFVEHSPEDGRYSLYNHDLVSGGVIYDGQSWQSFEPRPFDPPAVKRDRTRWDEDPLFRRLSTGRRRFDTAYISFKPPKMTRRPGLYVWLRDEAVAPNSIPDFGGDKAILHLADEPLAPQLCGLFGVVRVDELFQPAAARFRDRSLRAARELVKPDGVVRGSAPAGPEEGVAPDVLVALEAEFERAGLSPPVLVPGPAGKRRAGAAVEFETHPIGAPADA